MPQKLTSGYNPEIRQEKVPQDLFSTLPVQPGTTFWSPRFLGPCVCLLEGTNLRLLEETNPSVFSFKRFCGQTEAVSALLRPA